MTSITTTKPMSYSSSKCMSKMPQVGHPFLLYCDWLFSFFLVCDWLFKTVGLQTQNRAVNNGLLLLFMIFDINTRCFRTITGTGVYGYKVLRPSYKVGSYKKNKPVYTRSYHWTFIKACKAVLSKRKSVICKG